MLGFISGFVTASALWWVGILSAPKIKAWYDAVKSKFEKTP